MRLDSETGNKQTRRVFMKELFEEHYEKDYKTAFIILFDVEMAKDATQEAFLKAFKRIDTLKDIEKFEAWMRKIVTNTCRNMIKKKQYQNKNIVLFDNEEDIKYNVNGPDNYNIPEKLFEDMELKNELHKCINELDQDEQHILFLRFQCELSYEQIAKHLNLKKGTVKSKVHRAKEKIYQKIQGYCNMKGTRKV